MSFFPALARANLGMDGNMEIAGRVNVDVDMGQVTGANLVSSGEYVEVSVHSADLRRAG